MAQKKRPAHVQQNTYRKENRSGQRTSRGAERSNQSAFPEERRMNQSASRGAERSNQGAFPEERRVNQSASRGAGTQYRQPKKKKRRKNKRRRLKILAVILGVVAVLVLLGYFAVGVCKLKQIVVTGNQYCSQQEMLDWIAEGKYSDNSLYVFWKYNQKDLKQLPVVESISVKLKSPWKVQVQVKEKRFYGRIDYDDGFLYFDKEGMAALKTPDVIEGVPYIEGMEVDLEKLKIGAVLPVADSEVFDKISEISALLEEYELTPDKISCEDGGMTVHFGGIRVSLGSSGFADKLAQVPPILAKMSELYADQTGVLHLENYEISDSSIRFVPDTAPQGE